MNDIDMIFLSQQYLEGTNGKEEEIKMLWDIDNENDVIVNTRDLSVLYCGKKWYLVGHAKEMSKSARLIGRCGLYHFYLDDEGKGYCIHDWRDM